MMETQEVLRNLAPSGVLRVAMNYGNPVLVQRGASDSQPQGVAADLARAVAERLGVTPQFVSYDAAGKVVAGRDNDEWDLAFLAIDPLRAQRIQFTEAYVQIEGTYMVAKDAPFTSVDQLDQAGVRIAVGHGAAYDLFLSRHLQHASLERASTSAAAMDLFAEQKLDAAAGVRQPLLAYVAEHPEYRVLDGHFTAIQQAMAVPKERQLAYDWLVSFLHEMKHSNFIRAALEASGQSAEIAAP
ncbi:ABC transporter substrate-binding protein [Paenalcaligenes sp. Me131]|uniref:ABC transporter substrate-binding protein n=1 Tax=Paenalcaligenes sp. Me131 TaxID=3392636 RepID=UPI003D2B6D13